MNDVSWQQCRKDFDASAPLFSLDGAEVNNVFASGHEQGRTN